MKSPCWFCPSWNGGGKTMKPRPLSTPLCDPCVDNLNGFLVWLGREPSLPYAEAI